MAGKEESAGVAGHRHGSLELAFAHNRWAEAVDLLEGLYRDAQTVRSSQSGHASPSLPSGRASLAGSALCYDRRTGGRRRRGGHCVRTGKIEMPVKRRTNKKRDGISEHEAAWLQGDHDCGFVQFKHPDDLQALWDRAGDSETMFWEPPMSYPELK